MCIIVKSNMFKKLHMKKEFVKLYFDLNWNICSWYFALLIPSNCSTIVVYGGCSTIAVYCNCSTIVVYSNCSALILQIQQQNVSQFYTMNFQVIILDFFYFFLIALIVLHYFIISLFSHYAAYKHPKFIIMTFMFFKKYFSL